MESVPHLPTSVRHAQRWDEASQIADALCGRDRPARREGGPWAALIHADAPDAGTAEWLARILPVHGAVVAVGTGPRQAGDRARWARALDRARVPYGLLAVLSPERGARGALRLRSVGRAGGHLFELRTAWRPREHRIEPDAAGHCRVPVWLASDPRSAPPAGDRAGASRTPQIADGCRWWAGWRRCRRPRVLHVAADLTLTPCWNGPAIGRLGDALGEVLARAAALGGSSATPSSDRCPLDGGGTRARAAAAARRLEVVSQVAWVLQWGARRG